MTIKPGTKISKYEIIELIGRGGMADVYKARHVSLEMDVAIKFIRKERFPQEILPSVVKRFHNEARRMAKLSHPNIVRVSDDGVYRGVPYFVMDYLPGGTLKKYLGKPMPYREAARLLLPIARALTFAHAKGVVHRDVKPANVLLSEDGQPMLSDFGVAKIMDSDQTQGLTATGAAIGTPEYMAPEQAMGKQIDYRVDIYSLGIIFYELITGRRPFTADTPMEVVVKQSTQPLPPPSKYVKDLPEEVEGVLFKALAKAPGERYADMATFAAIMEGLSARRPVRVKAAAAPRKKAAVRRRTPITTNSTRNIPTEPTTPPISSSTLGIGSTIVSEKDGMTMVYVPEGEFIMGSNKGLSDEKPIHVVYLDNFWIDLTEVTNAMFARFLNEVGNQKEGGANWLENADEDAGISQADGTWWADAGFGDHPVVGVSWYGARAYCEWAERRLPTEAEWEKAARGTDGRTYPWGEGINCNLSNYRGCDKFPRTSPVSYYSEGASPYGALDMAGNVWEWVRDLYDAFYFHHSPKRNPENMANSEYKLLRGGSWYNKQYFARSAYLGYLNPDDTDNNVGFRCAMDAEK